MKDAEGGKNRAEPVWFTTADLMALVIGCTLALAIPWHSYPTAQIAMHVSKDALFFVHEGVNRFPLYLLFGIPAAGVMSAARHGRKPVRNWADMIGVGLAALLLFTDQVLQFWADAVPPPSWVKPLIAIHATQLVAATVLSSLIVSRVGSA